MKKFLFSRGFKILLLILVIFIGYKFYLNHKQVNQMQQEIKELKMEISRAHKTNQELKKSLEDINNMDYIEKIARKKLGLVKPGEMLLIPVEESDDNKDEENEK